MHGVILLMLVAVTTFSYVVSRGWLPAYLNYTPELLSLVVAVYIVVVGVQSRFRYVRPIYWLVFGALALVMICGAIVNHLQPGPMFAGLRYYLRAIPFFLLPATLMISDKQLRVQLAFLASVCVIQLPLAWMQRLETTESGRLAGFVRTTGDYVFGTLMTSGMLSLFLIGAACVLTALFMRKRISAPAYLLLLLVFLLPTTLNESKITLVILPIALLTTLYVGSAHGQRVRNMMLGLVVLTGFTAIFIPIYDHFMKPRWGYGIVDFMMMEGRVEGYLAKGVDIGDTRQAGRLDGIVAAKRELASDPAKLAFGLGIANASDSALGRQFDGAYYEVFAIFPRTALKVLILEWGLLGLLLVFLLHWLIFRDSIAVSKQDQGRVGALALGWTGVSTVIVIGIPYMESIASTANSYIYWYVSGLIMASRMRFELDLGTRISNRSLSLEGEGPPRALESINGA